MGGTRCRRAGWGDLWNVCLELLMKEFTRPFWRGLPQDLRGEVKCVKAVSPCGTKNLSQEDLAQILDVLKAQGVWRGRPSTAGWQHCQALWGAVLTAPADASRMFIEFSLNPAMMLASFGSLDTNTSPCSACARKQARAQFHVRCQVLTTGSRVLVNLSVAPGRVQQGMHLNQILCTGCHTAGWQMHNDDRI